jgi:2-polyprenyl-6-methoxyphenol hydroxylase-like FAD-dependent oxidoreductase
MFPLKFYPNSVTPDKAIIESGTKLKRFVLANLAALKVPAKALAVIEASDDVFAVPLRFRPPLSPIAASISKGGVCVAGDALHPMTPDLGQGACAALEDSVVLARCLGTAVLGDGSGAPEGRRRAARVRSGTAVEERPAHCHCLRGRLPAAEQQCRRELPAGQGFIWLPRQNSSQDVRI